MLKNFPIFMEDYIEGYIRFSADILPKVLKALKEELKPEVMQEVEENYVKGIADELANLLSAAKLLQNVQDHVFVALNKKINMESIDLNENFDSRAYINEIIDVLKTLEDKFRDILELGLKSADTGSYDPIYFDAILSYIEGLDILSGNKK